MPNTIMLTISRSPPRTRHLPGKMIFPGASGVTIRCIIGEKVFAIGIKVGSSTVGIG